MASVKGVTFLKTNLLVVSLLLAVIGSASAELNLELPETFKPSGTIAPPVAETIDFTSLGVKRLRAVRKRSNVIEDPELSNWIQGLGRKLVAQTGQSSSPFYFVIVRNDDVNAYATQGGLIVINSGLILRSDSESELAAVVAHETAHVTQRHIDRMIEQAKRNSVGTTAAMLAGLIVGSQDPTAGQAIVTSALAVDAHQSLTFSRAAETEADREGLRILANAGFNPQGMPAFLRKLADGVDPRYADISRYLSSHPMSNQRFNDVGERAARYGRYNGRENSDFFYYREKLRQLTRSAAQVENTPASIQKYASAQQFLQQGAAHQAIQTLQNPGNKMPEVVLLANAYNQARQYQQTIQLVQPHLARSPAEERLIIPMAEALAGLNRTEEAWKLMAAVRLNEQTSLELLESRQSIASQARKLGQAYYSIAERNIRIGEYANAITQLKLALKQPELTPHERQDIEQAIYRAERFKKP